MQDVFLILHKKDFKYSKNIRKIVPIHNYILNKIDINYNELLDIKISKKELIKLINYIDYLYEKILDTLYQNLNLQNNKNHSKRYWGIIIGPWLISYLQFMSRKWLEIKKIRKKENKKNIIFNYYYLNKTTPKNFSNYIALCQTNEFNINIQSELIKKYFYDKKFLCLKKIKISNTKTNKSLLTYNVKSNKIFYLLKYSLSLLNFIKIKRKIVIIHIGINLINEALLYIKKFSIPYLFTQLQFIDDKLAKSSNILDKKKRIKLIINLKPKNNLEKFIFSNICNYLPMSYLENFKKYYLKEKNFFPSKAKIILSATNHFTVDILKFWIARQVENKSKLYSIQHGANPGYSIFTANEYHDLKHSDKLVTWGWTENNKKILKGCFSLKRPKIKKNNKKILIVFNSNALFQLSLRSNLFFYDNNFYFSFFKNLIKKLMEISEEDLVIRLPKFKILADYLRADLLKFNKNIKIDNNINFLDSVKDSRLVLTSWDATIFLQSINLNVPVMAYWDQSNCIVRDHVLKYFIALRKNNVLSNDYNKISKFIFKNYDYLEEWWSNKETKSSVVNFRNNFCKEGDIDKKLLEYLD